MGSVMGIATAYPGQIRSREFRERAGMMGMVVKMNLMLPLPP